MGLQPMGMGGMGLKLMGMGWGRGNFCGDGADVHYRVTLYFTWLTTPGVTMISVIFAAVKSAMVAFRHGFTHVVLEIAI